MPTPPAAAWTRTDSPDLRPPRSSSAYSAVRNTSGTPAAWVNDQPSGIGHTLRRSAITTGPNAASTMPMTRSPTARSSTPGPTSSTTPAPSRPMIPASPGYMPSTFITSRKLTPAARIAIRTSPGSSADSACGHGIVVRLSTVPEAVKSSRHAESVAIGAIEPEVARTRRGA